MPAEDSEPRTRRVDEHSVGFGEFGEACVAFDDGGARDAGTLQTLAQHLHLARLYLDAIERAAIFHAGRGLDALVAASCTEVDDALFGLRFENVDRNGGGLALNRPAPLGIVLDLTLDDDQRLFDERRSPHVAVAPH